MAVTLVGKGPAETSPPTNATHPAPRSLAPDPTTTSWGTRRIPQFFSAYTWASLSRHVSRPIVAVPAARLPNSHECQYWFSPGISWNQLDPPPRRIRVPIRSGQG